MTAPHGAALFQQQARERAYLDELRELEQRPDGFRLILTMTEMKDSDSWSGETRRIDADMVKEATSGLPRPHYYVAGAPGWLDIVA